MSAPTVPRVDQFEVAAYTIPTEAPESDGTLTWDATTVVTVEVSAGGTTGLGFTYGAVAAATLAREALAGVVTGGDPMDVPGLWEAMARRVRNLGRPGVASHAIAAVDVALWDLKAKLLGLPLARLLGGVREAVPVYGSGGFTSMSDRDLVAQLAAWVGEGIGRVKMKIATGWGTDPGRDLERVALVSEALGDAVELYVDANGGYTRKQALRIGDALEDLDVRWYEEPVSSDDLAGLAQVRDGCDPDVTAGEYGYRLADFAPLAGAVDCLQADASRCAGITEWLRVAALAAAHNLDVSSHTAQSLHAHPATAIPNLRHIEYFADHARTDRLLFDGVLDPAGGHLRPDPDRPGLGLVLKRPDADRWRQRLTRA